MEEKFDVFGIRPIGEAPWLCVEAHEIAEQMHAHSEDYDASKSRWEIKYVGSMSRAEIEAQPEFDGW